RRHTPASALFPYTTLFRSDPVELADLELILAGVYRPLTGFLGSYDTAMVIAGGRLADGTAWPVPVTLSVPKELTEHERLVLQDPEGVPLAVLEVSEAWQDPTTQGFRLAGPLKALRAPAHGPFHRLRRRPDELRPREGSPGAAPSEPLLAAATRDFLHRTPLGQTPPV